MSTTNGMANLDALPEATRKIAKALLSFKKLSEGPAARANLAYAAGPYRSDAWANEITGFGTDRDKTTYGYIVGPRWLSDTELSNLYHDDDMAARMVDIVADEMFREPFVIGLGDPDADRVIDEKFDALEVRSKFAEVTRWARCYGGGALLPGLDDGRPASTPLNIERVKDLDYLYVLDRRMLWPNTYYMTDGHPKLGRPETYVVTVEGGAYFGAPKVVHESRLILFPGVPTGARERAYLASWDMSVLQRAYEALRKFNVAWTAVENLLVDGNQSVYSMSGLNDIIASNNLELLKEHIKAKDMFRSVVRALVIDAGGAGGAGKENFERQHATMTDIPQTLDKIMLRLSAAVQIPVTILMGQSPAGMNATGESDFRWFYDRIRSLQNLIALPRLRRLVALWLQTREGKRLVKTPPKSIAISFLPLWKETPTAEAARKKIIAETDAVQIQSQVWSPEKVRQQRGQPDGWDQDIRLTPEESKANERFILEAAKAMVAPIEEPDTENVTEEIDTDAVVETATLVLAPTDIASIVKVREARASVGLPTLGTPDDELTIPEFKAKYAEVVAVAANAEAGQPDGEPPPPAPSPFGGSFGGAASAGDGSDETTAESDSEAGEDDSDEELDAELLDLEKVEARADAKGCILAKGAKDRDGYGRSGNTAAHRVAWEEAKGRKIPEGMEIDHTCENRACINVDHLELVSHAENMRRIAERNRKRKQQRRLDAWTSSFAQRYARRDGSMRTFVLHRSVDETGVSGTGEVAEGVLFSDGKIAMRWRTATASTTIFDDIAQVLAVHGHGGLSIIRWTDGQT